MKSIQQASSVCQFHDKTATAVSYLSILSQHCLGLMLLQKLVQCTHYKSSSKWKTETKPRRPKEPIVDRGNSEKARSKTIRVFNPYTTISSSFVHDAHKCSHRSNSSSLLRLSCFNCESRPVQTKKEIFQSNGHFFADFSHHIELCPRPLDVHLHTRRRFGSRKYVKQTVGSKEREGGRLLTLALGFFFSALMMMATGQ